MKPKANHPWRRYPSRETVLKAAEDDPIVARNGPEDGHEREKKRLRRAKSRLTPAQRLAMKIREGLD